MPRMRFHDDSIRKFQKRHPNVRVTLSKLEECFQSNNVFKTLNGCRWVLNYDEFEQLALALAHQIQ